MREDIDALRTELRHMKTTRSLQQNALRSLPQNASRDAPVSFCSQNTPGELPRRAPRNAPVKFCSFYVRVLDRCQDGRMGKSELESLLGCSVTQYVRLVDVPFPSFKVKISESDACTALVAGSKGECFVAPWVYRGGGGSGGGCGLTDAYVHLSSLPKTRGKSHKGVKMSCWNCHGLSSSLPNLNSLMDPDEGSKIVVLSEHWLWPYDLHKLNDLDDEYDAVGKSDCRLTEDRDGGRGCGGI